MLSGDAAVCRSHAGFGVGVLVGVAVLVGVSRCTIHVIHVRRE